MTGKLNDMQRILLSTASQREDGHYLPLPETLANKETAARKALGILLRNEFAKEERTNKPSQTWREDEETRIGLIITDAGLQAIGAGEGDNSDGQAETREAKVTRPAGKVEPQAAQPMTVCSPQVRAGTKQAAVVDLLRSKTGASLSEMVQSTGWLPHTTRAALTGLKKRGFAISSNKIEGVTRYRIDGATQ